jgi:hypothetical protein
MNSGSGYPCRSQQFERQLFGSLRLSLKVRPAISSRSLDLTQVRLQRLDPVLEHSGDRVVTGR